MAEKLKLVDPNWMVWRVLREDKVVTDAEPVMGDSCLARTGMNLLKGLVVGYNGTYRVFPNEQVERDVDYTHLGPPGSGSLGWNVPPWAEENRGKVVRQTFYHERQGRVVRPTGE